MNDAVDVCWEGECGSLERGPYVKARNFYVGDEYCRHLREEHGHRYATEEDRYV